jgi:hypothetical protein
VNTTTPTDLSALELTRREDNFPTTASQNPFVFRHTAVAPALRFSLESAEHWRRRFEMKRAIRIALGFAVLAGGLAVAGASTANAQVRFEGSFPLPHGQISIGVGDGGYGRGGFGVGSYVPYGYDVYEDPDYGYGFEYDNYWYPCEQYGSQWVIESAPVYFHRDYRYVHPYRSYGYSRPYGGYGYSRPYGRSYDYRTYRRDDHRRWDGNRRWNGRDSWRNDRRRDDRWSRDRDRRPRW